MCAEDLLIKLNNGPPITPNAQFNLFQACEISLLRGGTSKAHNLKPKSSNKRKIKYFNVSVATYNIYKPQIAVYSVIIEHYKVNPVLIILYLIV